VGGPRAATAAERLRPEALPRSPRWQDDTESLAALERLSCEPWAGAVERDGDGVRVRLADGWIELAGAALEAGGSAESPLSDLAEGHAFSLQFWDANATKALHIGHLRNLAIGNSLAAALAQAGAQVERRSRISDMGRAMGEAMAGVKQSGRHAQAWSDGDEKSDHFVGACYADYVAAGSAAGGAADGVIASGVIEQAEDSLSREVQVHDDDADELIKRVLCGEREALELWYKTRAWVIAGQRQDARPNLGIAFDRVFFESDFLAETAELAENGCATACSNAAATGWSCTSRASRSSKKCRSCAPTALHAAHALADVCADRSRTRGHDLAAGHRVGVGLARDEHPKARRRAAAGSSTAASIPAAASSTAWSRATSARSPRAPARC